jgi:hypothetical protein
MAETANDSTNKENAGGRAGRFLGTVVFFALSLVQYVACYEGFDYFLGTHFVRWVIVALLFVTYMMRLDIVAAIIGFFGAWKAWVLPWPAALALSVVFMAMSLAFNRNPFKARLRGEDAAHSWNPFGSKDQKPSQEQQKTKENP